MKIVSWNVAGIRARIKNNQLQKFIDENDFDILCIQETKSDPKNVEIEEQYNKMFPYKIWNVNTGETQRKGFSGTCIWSKKEFKPYDPPYFDTEGRTCTIEFDNFILINVYTPNSQNPQSQRVYFRFTWDNSIREYIKELNKIKPVIICGDFNVAHNDIDITNPNAKRNKIAGFLDSERNQFQIHLVNMNYIDAFRFKNEKTISYTYWSNFVKQRTNKNGWRIDYFLLPENLKEKIISIDHLMETDGSDHCPIILDIIVY